MGGGVGCEWLIKAADGTELLHTDAYYTLNRTIPEK